MESLKLSGATIYFHDKTIEIDVDNNSIGSTRDIEISLSEGETKDLYLRLKEVFV